MAKSRTARIVKVVETEVEVEVSVDDVLEQAPDKDLLDECARRGIAIEVKDDTAPAYRIDVVELEDMRAAFNRRDWIDFLWTLEWSLPREFRGLSNFLGGKLKP